MARCDVCGNDYDTAFQIGRETLTDLASAA
jgi:hypothetical protein